MQTERRLTSFSHGAGCGCKLGPDDLLAVLAGLDLPPVPAAALVGADTGDDAAVYRLPSGEAVVATLDFFTPIVDDPYDWGRIAATNALSDVYAMGGTPFLALNIVSWPVDDLPREELGRVLQGGIDAAQAAGVSVLGGHSITDPEPKYGMVVLGLVDPEGIVRNSTAMPGAALLLSKPIGLGIIATALKRGVAPDDLVATAVELMTTSNAAAAAAMREAGVEAGTDVTGFGLLGHLRRLLEASGCEAIIDAGAVPVIPGVLDLARADVVPGGTKRNHAWLRPVVDWGELTVPEQLILADAQTSGGLLVAARDPGTLLASGLFTRVGEVVEGVAGAITVSGRPVQRHEVSTFS